MGEVKRLTCWHDHTGYHNNSRWIRFFERASSRAFKQSHTVWPTESGTISWRTVITNRRRYRAHFFWFPNDALVIDHAGNIKSMLGRYPRPGYTELAGAARRYRAASRRRLAPARAKSVIALMRRLLQWRRTPRSEPIPSSTWATGATGSPPMSILPTGRIEYC